MKRTAANHRLLACVAAFASILVFAFSANLLPAGIVAMAAELDVAESLLNQVFAAQFGAFFLTTLLGGIVADRYGKKLPLLTAALAVAAGATVWALTRHPASAFVAGVLLGIGGGVLESMGSALICDLYPTRRKLLLNLSQTVYCAGAVGAPALMGWLLPAGVSWRLFFGFLGLGSALLALLYLPSRIPPPLHHERIDPAKLKLILRRRDFLIPAIVLFAYVLSETCVVGYANLFLQKHRAAPASWAIYTVSLTWLAMGLGRLACAAIPEGLSYEKLLAGLCGGSALLMGLQAATPGWQASSALFIATGLAFSGAWPLIVGLTASRNPGNSGTVIGLTVAMGSLGCAAAPPWMDLLCARLPIAWAYPVASLPMWVGSGLLLWLAADRRPSR